MTKLFDINKSSVFFFLFLTNFTFSYSQNNQDLGEIKGKLILDTIWKSKVYLSHIPTFKDMNTMSREMIIAETEVDSFGNFSFTTQDLPKKDNFYRIHVSKKDAPAASLIIGGNEENHLFFIANKYSKFSINSLTKSFKDFEFTGSSKNNSLKKIDSLISINDFNSYSNGKRDFIANNLNQTLRHIADTSKNALVSLYALNQSNFESTYLENQNYYENYLEKWKSENSSYFQELRSKLPAKRGLNVIWYIIIGILLFALGFIVNYWFNKNTKSKNSKLKLLSIQERKIFDLIKQGQSNKEISESCSIGLSTVKSHISSIYSKLGVKSRKEAINLD